MTAFKWVLSEQFDRWYFVEYIDSENFAGWKEEPNELEFYTGRKYVGFFNKKKSLFYRSKNH